MSRDKRIVELVKAFVENPNIKNAIKMGDTTWRICILEENGHRVCSECMWDSVCGSNRIRMSRQTDEEISAMVLDAIQVLAMYEAKND